MKRLRSFSLAFLCLTGLTCSDESFVFDLEPPKITHALPALLKAEDNLIELHFSKPVVSVKSVETCFRFAKTEDVSQALLKRMSKTRSPDTVEPFKPVSVTLFGADNSIEVRVAARLQYTGEYSLWIFDCLRDRAGNKFDGGEFRFRVEEAPFTLISHDLTLAGDTAIFSNRRHFRFRFSHALANVPKDAVQLDGQALDAVLSPDASVLLVSSKEELGVDTSHHIAFSREITDVLGRNLDEPSIPFRTALEKRADDPKELGHVVIHGYDTFAEVQLETYHLHRAQFRFKSTDDVSLREVVSYVNSFTIENLEPNTRYNYEVEIENVFGQRTVETGDFASRVPPKIAINEILANPKVQTGNVSSQSEFIELYNYGEKRVDISQFTLEVGGKVCALSKSKEKRFIRPNSYILLVGNKFNHKLFNLPDSSSIVRMPRQSICGKMKTWPMPAIFLRDAAGLKVDQFLSLPAPKEKGFSVERLNPSEKNGKEKYCYSRIDTGPTPLQANGVVLKGCEDLKGNL